MPCPYCGRQLSDAERSFGIDSCLECVTAVPPVVAGSLRARRRFFDRVAAVSVGPIVGAVLIGLSAMLPWAQVVVFEPEDAGIDRNIALVVAFGALALVVLRALGVPRARLSAAVLAGLGVFGLGLGVADVAEVMAMAGRQQYIHDLTVVGSVRVGPGLFLAFVGSLILLWSGAGEVASSAVGLNNNNQKNAPGA
jgi:hypothetical protein